MEEHWSDLGVRFDLPVHACKDGNLTRMPLVHMPRIVGRKRKDEVICQIYNLTGIPCLLGFLKNME